MAGLLRYAPALSAPRSSQYGIRYFLLVPKLTSSGCHQAAGPVRHEHFDGIAVTVAVPYPTLKCNICRIG